MSMCRVLSCVVGRGCLLWPVHSLDKNLLAFSLLHSVLQGQICLFLQVFLDFLLYIQSPVMKRTFFLVIVLEGLRGLHKTSQSQLLWQYGWGIVLDYCRGFPGGSNCKEYAWNAGDLGSVPRSERSLGEGQTEFILLFLRLHWSTAFWTLLLTMWDDLTD